MHGVTSLNSRHARVIHPLANITNGLMTESTASPRIQDLAERWFAQSTALSHEETRDLFAWVRSVYARALAQATAAGKLAPRGAAVRKVGLALGWGDGHRAFRTAMLVGDVLRASNTS
jgi:hypothetical protein